MPQPLGSARYMLSSRIFSPESEDSKRKILIKPTKPGLCLQMRLILEKASRENSSQSFKNKED